MVSLDRLPYSSLTNIRHPSALVDTINLHIVFMKEWLTGTAEKERTFYVPKGIVGLLDLTSNLNNQGGSNQTIDNSLS